MGRTHARTRTRTHACATTMGGVRSGVRAPGHVLGIKVGDTSLGEVYLPRVTKWDATCHQVGCHVSPSGMARVTKWDATCDGG